MPRSTQHKVVWQHKEKIDLIKKLLKEKGVLADLNDSTLAERISVSKSHFSGSISKNNWPINFVTKLSELAKFDPDHPSWIDRSFNDADRERYRSSPGNYKGRDVAANFERHIREVLNLQLDVNLRVDAEPPNLVEQILTTFAIEGDTQQFSSQEPLNLYLKFELVPFRQDGYRYCFPYVKAHLKPKDNIKAITIDHTATNGAVALTSYDTSAKMTAHATQKNASWVIQSDTQSLSGYFMVYEPSLCKLVDYELGDTFDASMQACVLDGILTAEKDDKDKQDMLNDTNKKAMIEALLADNLADKSINGMITIGRHQLTVIETPKLDLTKSYH